MDEIVITVFPVLIRAPESDFEVPSSTFPNQRPFGLQVSAPVLVKNAAIGCDERKTVRALAASASATRMKAARNTTYFLSEQAKEFCMASPVLRLRSQSRRLLMGSLGP